MSEYMRLCRHYVWASMRAKHLLANCIRHKTLYQHYSKFTVRQVKTIFIPFMITVVTWRQIFEVFYRHNHMMVTTALLLRHIYRECLYNLACHHSRVLHELGSLHFDTGHCITLVRRVQVRSGVDGFQGPEGQTCRLPLVGKNYLSGPSW
jgi:hypothetical protein